MIPLVNHDSSEGEQWDQQGYFVQLEGCWFFHLSQQEGKSTQKTLMIKSDILKALMLV